MAASVVKIRRSSIPEKIPTVASLPLGELAINTNDGKVYIQQDSVGIGSTIILVNPWSVGLGSNTYNTFFTSGSVGIGTTLASQKLHVQGNVRITGGLYDSNNNVGTARSVLSSTGSGLSWIAASGGGISSVSISESSATQSQFLTFVAGTGTTTGFSVNTTGLVFNPSTGNFGIGTINPTSKLTVQGTVLVSSTTTSSEFVGGGSDLRNLSGTHLVSYASHSETSNSASSIAGISTYSQVGTLSGSLAVSFNDNFGHSVATSADGNTIIVGAIIDEISNSTSSGVVYVFDRVGSSFNQVGTLSGSLAVDPFDNFGYSLATSADGKTIIVSAIEDEIGATTSTGVVYVFDRVGNSFNQVGILSGSLAVTASDNFGYSVATSADGKTIIVGAYNDEIGANANSGLAYVFDRVGSSFNQVGILTGSLATNANDNFGLSVATSADGKTIIVGAYNDEIGATTSTGVVYVYDRVGSSFNQVGTLSGSLAVTANDNFGYSLATSADGKTIIVGAFSDEIGAAAGSGVVYVFDRVGNSFNQVGTLSGSLAVNIDDNFGYSVATSADGKTIIVGAPDDEFGATASTGVVYVFNRQGSSFNQVGILTGSLAVNIDDNFGYSVATSADGKTIIVGAYNDEIGATLYTGVVYVFDEIRDTYVYSGPTGNIGIGITNPSSKLTVQGDLTVSGVITATNFVGNLIGTVTSYETVTTADYAIIAGIATFATSAGSVIGGIGSITSLTVSGITTSSEFVGGGSDLRNLSGTHLVSYASHSETSNSALSIAGISTYSQVGILTGSLAVDANDQFGISVATSADGKTIIVGSYNDEIGATTSTGVVYVYDRVGNSFNQVGTLTGSLAVTDSDNFGYSLATSADGKTIIVGAFSDEIGANASSGVVYVFDRVGSSFNQVGTLSGSLAVNNDDNFGYSVATSADGKTIIVGARNDEIGAIASTGVVYVFNRVGSSFNQVGTLTGSLAISTNDNFGHSVATSADGKTIIVGAINDEIGGAGSTGVVYVFDRVGSSFNQVGTLSGSLAVSTSDNFGQSVATSADGKTIIVGALLDEIGENASSGVVYVFDRVGSSFNQVGILTGSLAVDVGDNFGFSLATSADGKTIIVGAQSDEIGVTTSTGVVYVFNRQGSSFNQVGILTGSFATNANDTFGYSLATSADGKTIIVGAYQDEIGSNTSSGVVYVFDETRDTYVYSGPTGNIGIGITNPSSKLTVQGDLTVSGVITATNFVGNLIGTVTTATTADYAIIAGIATFATSAGSVIGGIGSITSLTVSGITTSSEFVGGGSDLRNLSGTHLVSYASHSETSNSALSIAGISTYSQVGILTGSLAVDASDQFGHSVATSADGNTIIVGARSDEIGATTGTGVVYVFDRVGNSFNQVGILSGSLAVDNLDNFGYSVATSADGKTIIVGAINDEIGAAAGAGVAYVFDRIGSSFNQVGILTGSLVTASDQFGNSVATSADGKTIIVGALLDEIGENASSGVVYVFDRVGNSFNQVGTLSGSLAVDVSDQFGYSVETSADGKTIIVGARNDENGATTSTGVVYVFDRVGSSFNQVGILTGSFATNANDTFGYSLATSADGKNIIIGAIEDEIGATLSTGVVYVFDRVGNSFNQVGTLSGSLATNAFDYFGYSVATSADGTTIIVGAIEDEIGATTATGVVYVFNRQGSSFNQVGTLSGSLAVTASDNFGYSVATSADGKTIIVGAYRDEIGAATDTGVVYVFDEIRNTYVYSGPTGNIGIGITNPSSKLTVQGDLRVSGISTLGITSATNLTSQQLRIQSVGDKTSIISGNTASLTYNTGGGNIAICTNPSGDITLAVEGIPTDSTFDNTSLTFKVFVNQTGIARSCTAVTLNGLSASIKWSLGSLSAAISSGVTTTSGTDIFSFTGINTIGSASTTANYRVLGVVNGGFI